MFVTSGLTNLLAILGTFGLTVAGITTAAYGLFRIFGDRWLTTKFNERLEDYKHAQQREMETLRFNIGALMDRTTKLHQHEFDALPEIWARLNEAFGDVSSLISPFQTYPDLDKMSEPHLNEFLDNSKLTRYQKDGLRTGSDKTTRYMKIIFWYDLHSTQNKYNDFNNYFVTKAIFLEKNLKTQIAEVRDLMHGALVEKKLEEQHPDPRPDRFKKGEVLRKEGAKKVAAIGDAVRSRLWSARSMEVISSEPKDP